MKRICIDMDEVIADTLGEHIRRYNRDFNENVRKEELTGKWLWEVVPSDRHNALQAYLDSDDFFESLPVFDDAQRVIKRLQQSHDVFIATAAMEVPASFAQKFRWLAKYFPTIPPSNIVYCGDKGILRADYLIDDNPRQLRRFQGEGLLYTSPHNLGINTWQRVNGWLDVEKLFFG